MALVGYEGLVVVAVLAIVFLWGPHKLPELARSLGQAKREFEKAAREASTGVNAPSSFNEAMLQDPLIVAAKSLGIQTEGKTKEEIAKEIASRSVK